MIKLPCCRNMLYVAVVVFCLAASLSAQVSEPIAIPDGLSATVRADFEARRDALLARRSTLQGEIGSFNGRCGRVVANSPEAASCGASMGGIRAAISQYNADVDEFNRLLQQVAQEPKPAEPPQVDCAEAERDAAADRREIEKLISVRQMNQEELETWSRLNAKAQQEAVISGVKFVLGTVALGAEGVRTSTTALEEKAAVLAKNAARSQTAARRAKNLARLSKVSAEFKPLNDKLLLQTIAEKSVGAYDMWTASKNTMQHEFRRAAKSNEDVRALLRDPEFREAVVGDDVETPGHDVMTQLTEAAINETATFAESLEHYTPLVAETVNAASFCRDASYNALLSILSTQRVLQQNTLAGDLARSSKVIQEKYKRSIDRLHSCRTAGPPVGM